MVGTGKMWMMMMMIRIEDGDGEIGANLRNDCVQRRSK